MVALRATSVHAAILHVPGVHTTIQDAVNSAAFDDTIDIAPGVYTGDLNARVFANTPNLLIRSIAGPRLTIVDLENCDWPWEVHNAATIEGITFVNGSREERGGAILCGEGVTIRGCVFRDNDAFDIVIFVAGERTYSWGGAINITYGIVEDCLFIHNRTKYTSVGYPGFGGAIYGTASTISRCTFIGNGSEGGKGGAIAGDGLTIEDCSFVQNWSGDIGTAVFFHGSNGSSLIRSSTFRGQLPQWGIVDYPVIAKGEDWAQATIERSIVVQNQGIPSTCNIAIQCSDFFGNSGGDWDSCLGSQLIGNLNVDPQFCNDSLDWWSDIQPQSFCSEANSPCAERIGCGMESCTCPCNCQSDPDCNLSSDIVDVVMVIDRAFRASEGVFDPPCLDHWIAVDGRTDVDCSGYTDVLDVVRIVTVGFRNGDPATEFCDPCQ